VIASFPFVVHASRFEFHLSCVNDIYVVLYFDDQACKKLANSLMMRFVLYVAVIGRHCYWLLSSRVE